MHQLLIRISPEDEERGFGGGSPEGCILSAAIIAKIVWSCAASERRQSVSLRPRGVAPILAASEWRCLWICDGPAVPGLRSCEQRSVGTIEAAISVVNEAASPSDASYMLVEEFLVAAIRGPRVAKCPSFSPRVLPLMTAAPFLGSRS